MVKMDFNSDALFSAVKRKNMRDLLVFVLAEVGETKASEIMNDKTRITDAAITELRQALVGIERVDTEEVETPLATGINVEEDGADDVVTGSIEEHNAILKAIKKGKGKKALKLIKVAIKGGARGSEIEKLKAQAKAL